MLVITLTCPSKLRIGALVSRSHISTAPVGRAAATNRPDGSNLAKDAPAKREVCIVVGCEILKKGSEMMCQLLNDRIFWERTDEGLIHSSKTE